MCLAVDRIKTKKHNNIKNKTYIFYKRFSVDCNLVFTSYTNTSINTKIVKAKGRLNIDDVFGYKEIHGGAIHAYTLKFNVYKKHIYNKFLYDVILSINVHSDDIIAFGINNDVCFFKYQFTKKSLEWLKKQGIKLN